MRLDVWLHRVCLIKSRSQAKTGCQNGKILLSGSAVKESHSLRPGERITLLLPHRRIEVQVTAIPEGNVSRKDAAEYYSVVEDVALDPETL